MRVCQKRLVILVSTCFHWHRAAVFASSFVIVSARYGRAGNGSELAVPKVRAGGMTLVCRSLDASERVKYRPFDSTSSRRTFSL